MTTSSDVDVLGEMLFAVLDSVEKTFEEADVKLPERRYIAWGGVAVDCEQVTAQLVQIYPGTPGGDPNQIQRCMGPRTAVIVVQIFRCAPTPTGPKATAPGVDVLNDSARAMAKDAWLLLDSAKVFDVEGSWGSGVIADVSPIEPSGGFVGTTLTVTSLVP